MLIDGKVTFDGEDVVIVRQIILRILMAARTGRIEDVEDEVDFLREVLFHSPDAYKAKPFFEDADA